MKKLMKRETRRKLRLIKKYAKIRFKRFWNEWGITKEQAFDLLTLVVMGFFLYELYIIGYILM